MGEGRRSDAAPGLGGQGVAAVGALAGRIRRVYASLSPAQTRVADLLLADGERLVGASATELAGRAGVSTPTVTRFVAALGLDGFRELHTLLRAEHTVAPGSPLALLQEGLAATSGDLGTLAAETLRADTDDLARTFAELDLDVVAEVVDWLATSPQVLFVAFRKNHALAAYAATLFNSIRPRVRALPERGTSAADGLLDVAVDDLVVMFPFRRAQRDHELTSAAVVAQGARLVTIGDRYPNPADARAVHHLVCQTDGVGVFDSLTAAMSLVGLLFTATARTLGDAAEERLVRLEAQHEHFGTFLTGGQRVSDRSGRSVRSVEGGAV